MPAVQAKVTWDEYLQDTAAPDFNFELLPPNPYGVLMGTRTGTGAGPALRARLTPHAV